MLNHTDGVPSLPTLPVVRTLGGCGGTVLSRLFAALPRTIVLSETNPRSVHLFDKLLNPVIQIRRSYPEFAMCLKDFDEYEIGFPLRFGSMLEALYRACAAKHFVLLIRDFNYVDFIGVPFAWPVHHDLSLDCAAAGRFSTRSIILARRPAFQLASLRSHSAIARTLSAERFLKGSLAFLDALSTTAIFRYEEFVANPPESLQLMCSTLSLSFDASVFDRLANTLTLTGNHRGQVSTGIEPPKPSDAALSAEAELGGYPDYERLLARLGYTDHRGSR
jgi:hypothetical protein